MLAFLSSVSMPSTVRTTPPNLVLVMLDDLGWAGAQHSRSCPFSPTLSPALALPAHRRRIPRLQLSHARHGRACQRRARAQTALRQPHMQPNPKRCAHWSASVQHGHAALDHHLSGLDCCSPAGRPNPRRRAEGQGWISNGGEQPSIHTHGRISSDTSVRLCPLQMVGKWQCVAPLSTDTSIELTY